ncbi:MAG: hypothetical protein PHH09_10150 [Methanoregulaceae archaeon]|nr:hypothetical protein [Methanoregulaceae archaeon]HRX33258.1 hypothetical protein [Methanoregulaceae archaeon]
MEAKIYFMRATGCAIERPVKSHATSLDLVQVHGALALPNFRELPVAYEIEVLEMAWKLVHQININTGICIHRCIMKYIPHMLGIFILCLALIGSSAALSLDDLQSRSRIGLIDIGSQSSPVLQSAIFEDQLLRNIPQEYSIDPETPWTPLDEPIPQKFVLFSSTGSDVYSVRIDGYYARSFIPHLELTQRN